MVEPALDDYRAKRQFARTPEPSGTPPSAAVAAEESAPRWVVQQHAARRLHYDFRLEAGGALVSWAVPKGPSYDPGAKRLAVKVEDHPLDYRHFEGAIPAGNYGAGSVIVWDEGTYRNLTTKAGQAVPVLDAIEAGHVSVWLEGSKLTGGWSLTRFDGAHWTLVKRNDERADPQRDVTTEQPRSVRSGRTVAETAEVGRPPESLAPATFCPPMLAQTEVVGPDGRPGLLAMGPGQWLYEPKLDGLRCLAVRNGDEVTLWSRNRLAFNARFPSIVNALRDLPAPNFVIDGELVAMVEDRADFGALQRGQTSSQFWAFDLPWLLGRDLRHLAVEERKALLARTVTPGPELNLVPTLEGDPARLYEAACQQGWEGLVAKRRGSAYGGGRSPDWRKLKCGFRHELVVGGFTAARGGRDAFGALLLGYWEDGELVYAGKVGTGFNRAELKEILGALVRIERPTSPFRPGTRTDVARWVEPELVVEVGFSNWTAEGRLRHPRFVRLRPDKASPEVVRES